MPSDGQFPSGLHGGYRRTRAFLAQIAMLAVLSLLLAAISANAWRAGEARKRAEAWYTHTLDVLLDTGVLRAGVYAELRGERGYLLTHNTVFLDPYYDGRAQAAAATARLVWRTRDNPAQVRNLARLAERMRRYEALLATTVALERDGRHARAVGIVRTGLGKHHIEAVLAVIDAMDREEQRLLRERRQMVERAMARTDLYQYSLSVVGFLLVLLSIWTAASARRAQSAAARLNAELERLATSDVLTGLANRRAFFARVEPACAANDGAVIAILDIDHFKSVNDTYGHPVGDQVLQEIAALLRSAVRAGDLVGRIGGEEFAIYMPHATIDQAARACERARAMVAAHVVALADGRSIRISISVGVAALAPGESVEAWMTKADAALYRAKAAGRNTVLLAA